MNNMYLTGSVVTLVTIPEFLPVLQTPHLGEYDNPFILKLTPCNKRGDKYYDLLTGCEVKKTPATLEWLNLSGTVFRYPDGMNVLISKKLNSDIMFCMSVPAQEIRHTMMPRRIFDRRKEKDVA